MIENNENKTEDVNEFKDSSSCKKGNCSENSCETKKDCKESEYKTSDCKTSEKEPKCCSPNNECFTKDEKLIKELTETTKQLRESKDKLRKTEIDLTNAVIELQNFRGKTDRMLKEEKTRSTDSFRKFAKDIIEILDILNIAIDMSEGENKKGMKMVLSKALDTLSKYNILQMEEKEEFDAHLHEAIELDSSSPKNKIVKYISAGYLFEGVVLRTAKVKIGTLD
jgi:molecular chaperone GrpE